MLTKNRFLSISNYCRYAIISDFAVGNIHECLNLTEPLICNIKCILTRFIHEFGQRFKLCYDYYDYIDDKMRCGRIS